VEVVEDPADPRLAPFRAVRHGERALRRDGLVLAESPRTVERVLAGRHAVVALLLSPAVAERLAPLAGATPMLVAERAVLAAAIGFDLHRGALALVAPASPPTVGQLVTNARRLVVLEGLNDLENLGVIFRTAAALGVDGVILCPRSADPWSRRVVRVSVGGSLDVPWARAAEWPGALDEIAATGLELVALTPAATTDVRDLAWPERAALLVGAEGPGLTTAALAAAHHQVAIAMAHGVDSLNVATATAIALWAAT
jgi:tRNA G18 (ribose-2'-O)-methylase SpoU